MHYKIGTRGSALALAQTEIVIRAFCRAYPEDTCEAVVIRTKGDKIQDKPLDAIGGKGLFVEEIEKALLEGEIQMAVHSLKDMPDQLPKGLVFSKALKREDARDVLITRTGCSLKELPQGAVIATGSQRRSAELRAIRSDLRIVGIRGNVDTRIRRLKEGLPDGTVLDGIVIAAAGLIRLGREEEITCYLEPEDMVPSPGQGILAVEVREDNRALLEKLNALSDASTERAVAAERGFLNYTGGNCRIPVGACYREYPDGSCELRTLLGTEDGNRLTKVCVRRTAEDIPSVPLAKEMAGEAWQKTKEILWEK